MRHVGNIFHISNAIIFLGGRGEQEGEDYRDYHIEDEQEHKIILGFDGFAVKILKPSPVLGQDKAKHRSTDGTPD